MDWNFWKNMIDATNVNTIVTVISIICAFYSFCQAKSAKVYKEKTRSFMHMFDIFSYSERFHSELKNFITISRGANWNKGRNMTELFGKLSALIQDMNQIFPLIEDNDIVNAISLECDDLKTFFYDKFSSMIDSKKIILQRFDNIDRLLSQYINKQKSLVK